MAHTKQEALLRAEALGANAGTGSVALTDLAIAFTGFVKDGALLQSDGGEYYLAYANAANAQVTRNADLIPVDAEGSKSSISILKTFGLPAVVAAGPGWFDRIDVIRAGLKSEERVSVYNSYVKANRALRDKQDADKIVVDAARAAHATAVPDSEVAGWISKSGKAEKSDMDKLRDMIAKLAKLGAADTFKVNGMGPMILANVEQLSLIVEGKVSPALTVVKSDKKAA